MQLRTPRALIAACGAWSVATALAASADWPPAAQALLHSARSWEAHERGDLAQLALQKLVAARPDSPQVLLELGELDLRLGDFPAAAAALEQLQRRFPAAPATRSLAVEYRIAAHGRVQLAAVIRLLESGHVADAHAAFARLFPEGAPADALGIEYYELQARFPLGWAPAYAGLKRLMDQHPGDPRYQLALARHLLRRADHAGAAIDLLLRLAPDEVRGADVEALLALGIRSLGYAHAPPQLLRDYLARHPNDADIAAILGQQQRAEAERRLLDPGLTVGLLTELQQRVQAELSQANTAESRRQALQWLARSRAAALPGQRRLAATYLRAAIAFQHSLFETQIAVAQDLEAMSAVTEAGELLAVASALDSGSAWLFETYTRWLIEHGRGADAIAALEGRAIRGKWTVTTREALLSSAHAQVATAAEAGGHIDAATTALEQALQHAPRDVWLRYRLANLYRRRQASERGRALMNTGVREAPGDDLMRYAQALYLASLEDHAAALAALEAIATARRTGEMDALYGRLRVRLACDAARRLAAAGDLDAARAALAAVESFGTHNLERAAELAYAWIAIGDGNHGIALVEPFVNGGAPGPATLMIWAQVLNSADDTDRLRTALERLNESALDATGRVEVARLQRAMDLRVARFLIQARRFAEAAQLLDALLRQTPQDRELRALRADLYLANSQPWPARDLLALLVAERPDDLAIRLAYIRALTESGDLRMARAQLHAVAALLPADAAALRIELARRALDLGEPRSALTILQALLAVPAPRTEVWLLAGRAELAQRHFAAAHDYFAQAERTAVGTDAETARQEREALDARLQSSATVALSVRHQPGDPGMSQLDVATIPSAWLMPLNYESRLTARADAVLLDAGRPNGESRLLGTIAAAPTQIPHYGDGQQGGMSLGVGYRTDSLAADLGTTPLGFLHTNLVGGIEWNPQWSAADLTVGVARRAVTNSELSYAGLRDPITGATWGAVVQSGPYAAVGLYRSGYSVAGALQISELTGEHVLSNQFLGLHLAADRRFWSSGAVSATVGGSLNYWNYQHNLSNYTWGSGGYYSPQSYVSVALPIELQGTRRGWSFRLRAAASYSVSSTRPSDLFPDDAALQSIALRSPLPGYTAGVFADSHENAFGFSALAVAERRITAGLVIGGSFDIDRTNYYHPSTVSIYIRHGFGSAATPLYSPPRSLRPYSP